jgi:hypothetical protein
MRAAEDRPFSAGHRTRASRSTLAAPAPSAPLLPRIEHKVWPERNFSTWSSLDSLQEQAQQVPCLSIVQCPEIAPITR